jgi:choline-sulfatase
MALAPQLHAQAAPDAKNEALSVVLITVEALRRDHQSGEGYVRETTPVLDAFSSDALVFTRAYTTCSATVPAHLSLLSGLDVAQSGVAYLNQARRPIALDGERRTAAALLAQHGWRTAAFVADPQLGKLSGLDVGFHFMDEPGLTTRPAEELAQRAGKWLDANAKEHFFLWLAFDGGNEPNLPPPEFAARFKADAKIDALLDARGIEPSRYDLGFAKLLQIRMFFPELEAKITPRPEVKLPPVDRDVFRSLYDRYDAEVCATDAAIGTLLAKLDALALRERCVVVIAGAFGQALGDRTQLGHGEVTREQVNVPLALRAPGLAPTRSERLVSLVDVLPTAFALAHAPAAQALATHGAGRDLLAAGFERDAALVRRAVRENERLDPGPIWALYTRGFKYVYRPQLTDQLYDLSVDPDERENVLSAQLERGAALKKDLLARIGNSK